MFWGCKRKSFNESDGNPLRDVLNVQLLLLDLENLPKYNSSLDSRWIVKNWWGKAKVSWFENLKFFKGLQGEFPYETLQVDHFHIIFKTLNFSQRVLKVHRIILTAEMALKFFASRVFKIDNFSFNDLSLLVPEDEKNDFALSTEPNGNIHLYHKTYLLMLEATFKESPADMPKARRRYRKVVLIVKTVHLMAFYIAFRLLNKLVLSLWINEIYYANLNNASCEK